MTQPAWKDLPLKTRIFRTCLAVAFCAVPLYLVSHKEVAVKHPQEVLEEGRSEFFQRYDDAPNNVVEDAVWLEASNWTRSWAHQNGLQFKQWRGRMAGVFATLDRQEIHFEIESKRGLVKFRYIPTNYPKRGSPLYALVATLGKGDEVLFDGTFWYDDKVGLRESSFTEDGALREPELRFEISSLAKVGELAVAADQPLTARASPPIGSEATK